jgi:hypothetical protein
MARLRAVGPRCRARRVRPPQSPLRSLTPRAARSRPERGDPRPAAPRCAVPRAAGIAAVVVVATIVPRSRCSGCWRRRATRRSRCSA